MLRSVWSVLLLVSERELLGVVPSRREASWPGAYR